MIFTHSDGRRSEPAKLKGFIAASKNYEAEAHFFRDRYGMKELEKSNWRLGLRPLSDMTDEEKVEMKSLMGRQTDSVHPVYILVHSPYSFQYLLKQGFDLFGLIEAGLAVDKTKEAK